MPAFNLGRGLFEVFDLLFKADHLAVFLRVRDALNAALIVQIALAMEKWPTSTPIRVRMAIHTGHVELRDGDYYGPTVNLAARALPLAPAGSIVTDRPIEGFTCKPLGPQQLRSIAAPVELWVLSR